MGLSRQLLQGSGRNVLMFGHQNKPLNITWLWSVPSWAPLAWSSYKQLWTCSPAHTSGCLGPLSDGKCLLFTWEVYKCSIELSEYTWGRGGEYCSVARSPSTGKSFLSYVLTFQIFHWGLWALHSQIWDLSGSVRACVYSCAQTINGFWEVYALMGAKPTLSCQLEDNATAVLSLCVYPILVP
jgi:hypothetical protein